MNDSTNIPKPAHNACNIGEPSKRVKNKDGWTWRVVKGIMKKSRLGDEIGFTIGRAH